MAASIPTMLVAANIRNTERIPCATTRNPTTAGPAAEAIRNQDVANPDSDDPHARRINFGRIQDTALRSPIQ